MERLLEDVAEHGWTVERREAFVHHYDRRIGEALLDLLVEYGLLGDRRALRSVKSYVESRLRGQRAESEHPLWEIVEEVYMRVYSEIFRKKLIENYVNGVRAGAVQSDFASYLRGAVRRRLLDRLPRRSRCIWRRAGTALKSFKKFAPSAESWLRTFCECDRSLSNSLVRVLPGVGVTA